MYLSYVDLRFADEDTEKPRLSNRKGGCRGSSRPLSPPAVIKAPLQMTSNTPLRYDACI